MGLGSSAFRSNTQLTGGWLWKFLNRDDSLDAPSAGVYYDGSWTGPVSDGGGQVLNAQNPLYGDGGAKGDGSLGDAAAIADALSRASSGDAVLLPRPTSYYNLGTTELVVPAGVSLLSQGRAIPLRVADGFAGNAITIEDASTSQVRGLHLAPVPGATLTSASRALVAYGSIDDGALEDIFVDAGFGAGVVLSGDSESVVQADRTIRRKVLRNVRVQGTISTYGIELDECEIAELYNCHVWDCALDGFKFRKNNLFVVLWGGSALRNGQRANPGSSLYDGTIGDGLDAYSGGRYLQVHGTVFKDNLGNGIVWKADGFHNNETDDYDDGLGDIFGYQRSTSINAVTHGNRAYGVAVYRNDAGAVDADNVALPPYATVRGIHDRNGLAGVYVNSLHAVVDCVQANENHGHGILVDQSAFGVRIIAPTCCGNGKYNRAQTVTASAAALTSATVVKVNELTESLADGTALVFSGGVTATLTIFAPKGSTGVVVSALSGGIAAGETATVTAGKLTGGEGYGIDIEGKHVKVLWPTCWGISSDRLGDATGTTDIDGNTPATMHARPIRVLATAEDVEIHYNARDLVHATSERISVVTGSTDVILHGRGAAAPTGASGQPCSPGSTFINDGAANEHGIGWVKVSGDAEDTDGWKRTRPSVLSNQTVGTSETTIAHSLGYTPTVISVLPRADATFWRTKAADATNVYLAASSSVACDISVL